MLSCVAITIKIPKKGNEIMKTIVFTVFAGLGWFGAAWSSGLWDQKDGFLWGLLASVFQRGKWFARTVDGKYAQRGARDFGFERL